VKLPTGAASVSTRKADFALDLEASRDVGRFSPTLAIGYRFLGDPDFLPLEDGWSLSAGTGVTLGKVFVAASYERSEAALGGPDPQEAFLLAAGPIAQRLELEPFRQQGPQRRCRRLRPRRRYCAQLRPQAGAAYPARPSRPVNSAPRENERLNVRSVAIRATLSPASDFTERPFSTASRHTADVRFRPIADIRFLLHHSLRKEQPG
jgi:hypothetical protein